MRTPGVFLVDVPVPTTPEHLKLVSAWHAQLAFASMQRWRPGLTEVSETGPALVFGHCVAEVVLSTWPSLVSPVALAGQLSFALHDFGLPD